MTMAISHSMDVAVKTSGVFTQKIHRALSRPVLGTKGKGMKAEISYEVRAVKFDGDSYGSTYTERTIWRVITVGGKSMGEGVPVAKFDNNKEADLFEEWLKDRDLKSVPASGFYDEK